ncbi:hypothetical protein N9878_01300 [bacterium]|nr:hypothetical protein [bacterium]
MKQSQDSKSDGYISVSTYQDKYNVSKNTVHRLISAGSIGKYSVSLGNGGPESTFVEDKYAFARLHEDRYRGDEKLCGSCRSWLAKDHYTEHGWNRTHDNCALCNQSADATRRGRREAVSEKRIIAMNVDTEIEKRLLPRDLLKEREDRILQHMKRVERDGQAGNGTCWPKPDKPSD